MNICQLQLRLADRASSGTLRFETKAGEVESSRYKLLKVVNRFWEECENDVTPVTY